MKFTRKNPDGKVIPQTYYTTDYKFEIEKGATGWNVNILRDYGAWKVYEYSFSCESLKEAKESIAFLYV